MSKKRFYVDQDDTYVKQIEKRRKKNEQ